MLGDGIPFSLLADWRATRRVHTGTAAQVRVGWVIDNVVVDIYITGIYEPVLERLHHPYQVLGNK
jgi:hypothetical protein